MIRKGEDKYIGSLKEMWKLCFPMDTAVFIDFYFEKVYKNEETLIYVENEIPVASLQVIPYPLKINQNITLAGYVSGAMTHPDFRHKGYMKELMNAAFDGMKEKGFNYSFLIPQEEELVDFYTKFGYKKAFPRELQVVSSAHFQKEKSEKIILRDKKVWIHKTIHSVNIDDFFTIYYRFLMENRNVVLKTKSQAKNMLEDLFIDEGVLFSNDWGIAFVLRKEEKVHVKEFFYSDIEIKNEFLETIMDYYQTDKLILNRYIFSNPDNHYGMLKNLYDSSATIPGEIYMSMMLD